MPDLLEGAPNHLGVTTMNTTQYIHNGNTFVFSVTITECYGEHTRHHLMIRSMTRGGVVDAAIKKVYGNSAVFFDNYEMSTAGTTFGQAGVRIPGDGSVSMFTGRLCVEVERKPSSVTIGNATFTANRTARSVEAVSAIAKVKASIEALGFVVDTNGPSAGRSGRFNVYVYPSAAMHQVGSGNRAADAAYVFSVQYMKGRWFASNSAVAESMAYGLKEALNALGASLVAA